MTTGRPTTQKSSDSREQRLRRLGEALLALTPEQRENVVRVTANLLAIRANEKAPTQK